MLIKQFGTSVGNKSQKRGDKSRQPCMIDLVTYDLLSVCHGELVRHPTTCVYCRASVRLVSDHVFKLRATILINRAIVQPTSRKTTAHDKLLILTK